MSGASFLSFDLQGAGQREQHGDKVALLPYSKKGLNLLSGWGHLEWCLHVTCHMGTLASSHSPMTCS